MLSSQQSTQKQSYTFGLHRLKNQAVIGIFETKLRHFSFLRIADTPHKTKTLLIHKFVPSEANRDEVFMFSSMA